MKIARRGFLTRAGSAGVTAGLGGFNALLPWSSAAAADVEVQPDIVRFGSEIEPLVRLFETTPRDRCVEMLATSLRQGKTFKEILAGLFLAGIRDVSSQPPGGKFHCVFVVHSAQYLSRLALPEERMLPLFWVLDYFKQAQQRDIHESDYVMKPLRRELPASGAAVAELHAALRAWDAPRAERAAAALGRSDKCRESFDMFWEYGARDVRALGHKAIFVAHTWRTLETIGWRHAEPALRSLVLSLLYYGKDRRHRGFAFEDQCYRSNVERVRKWSTKLPQEWEALQSHRATTRALLELMRGGRTDEACEAAIRNLAGGTCRAQAIWDATHLAAGELIMRQTNILGIHATTSLNGLRFAYHSAQRSEARLLLLLQAVGWMAQFRHMTRDEDAEVRITELAGAELSSDPAVATEAILGTITDDLHAAGRLAFKYGQSFDSLKPFVDTARTLVFAKTDDVHQYKWPAAVFEDLGRVSPEWRPHLLAASTYYLRGTGHRNSAVVEQAVQALRSA